MLATASHTFPLSNLTADPAIAFPVQCGRLAEDYPSTFYRVEEMNKYFLLYSHGPSVQPERRAADRMTSRCGGGGGGGGCGGGCGGCSSRE